MVDGAGVVGLVAVVGVLTLAYLLALAWQHRRYAGEPPVVWSWLPFLGSAISFGKAPLDFVRDCAAPPTLCARLGIALAQGWSLGCGPLRHREAASAGA